MQNRTTYTVKAPTFSVDSNALSLLQHFLPTYTDQATLQPQPQKNRTPKHTHTHKPSAYTHTHTRTHQTPKVNRTKRKRTYRKISI